MCPEASGNYAPGGKFRGSGDDKSAGEVSGLAGTGRLRLQAQLLEAIGPAVIATDLYGRVLYWNQAAERLYGWSAREVTGRVLREFLISKDFWENAEKITSQLRKGRSWSGEFEVRRKDGTPSRSRSPTRPCTTMGETSSVSSACRPTSRCANGQKRA
jgi:PAS domain S-box-containing protein